MSVFNAARQLRSYLHARACSAPAPRTPERAPMTTWSSHGQGCGASKPAAPVQSTALCRYGVRHCDCCDRTSQDAKWAAYYQVQRGADGEAVRGAPQFNDCWDCVTTGQARHPGMEWKAIKLLILADENSREQHKRMCRIRRGEEQQSFLPESVWQTSKVTGRWITTLVPQRVSDLEKQGLKNIRSVPGVRLENVEDGAGSSHLCVLLKDDRFPDRLEMTVEKSTEIKEHCFDGATQLDSAQATEIYDQLRRQLLESRPERHFGVAMTLQGLRQALQPPAPPTQAPGAGLSEAGAPAAADGGDDANIVSMVSDGATQALAQRLAAPQSAAPQAPGAVPAVPSGARVLGGQGKRARVPVSPQEKAGGQKRQRVSARSVTADGPEDSNYLKLPSMADILSGDGNRGGKSIKTLLYHFKLQLDNAHGLPSSEQQRLSKEHLRKTAAAQLERASMRALPAVEFAAAYRLVAQAADDLPLIFWVNVLDREFKQKFDAPRFVPDLGAFLSLGAASRTLEECRTRGSPQSLAEIPEVCLKLLPCFVADCDPSADRDEGGRRARSLGVARQLAVGAAQRAGTRRRRRCFKALCSADTSVRTSAGRAVPRRAHHRGAAGDIDRSQISKRGA